MIALLVHSGLNLPVFNLAPSLLLLTIVPICLVFAPQSIRRDKRVRVFALLLLLLLFSAPAWAVPTDICKWCPWCFECWFL